MAGKTLEETYTFHSYLVFFGSFCWTRYASSAMGRQDHVQAGVVVKAYGCLDPWSFLFGKSG